MIFKRINSWLQRFCDYIAKGLKENAYWPKILSRGKLSFKIEGQIETISDQQNWRELLTNRPNLQEILKRVLQAEKASERNSRPDFEYSHHKEIINI